MILLSHPTGNEFSRNAGLALAREKFLAEFWTSVSWEPERAVAKLLPSGLRALLGRRAFPHEVRPFVRSHPLREASRLLAERLRWQALIRHEEGPLSIDRIYRSLDERVARRLPQLPQLEAVYAYEDGALETFKAAKRLGLRCVYELPIGYWRAARELLEEEAGLRPDWAVTLQGNQDSAAKVARKDAEIALADLIIVASTFTQNTLTMAPDLNAPVRVVPYGAPTWAAPRDAHRREPGQKLRVLFVGVLEQRKGISYLFEAIDQVGVDVELTVIGRRPRLTCPALDRQLARHRWIASLPHDQILAEMARHDVFVFPTLFEGFGLVILEAMSQGLPVITTAHSAAPDAITHGVDGYIVPIRNPAAIAQHLEALASSPDLLAAMGEAARLTAEANTWEKYRRQWFQAINGARLNDHQ